MIYNKILTLCKEAGISPTKLTEEIGIGSSNVTYWKKGSHPRTGTLKKIADYFGVPIDTFTDELNITAVASNITNSNIVQGNHAQTLIVKNGELHERELSDQEAELLRIYNSLNVKEKTVLLSFAFELEEKNK